MFFSVLLSAFLLSPLATLVNAQGGTGVHPFGVYTACTASNHVPADAVKVEADVISPYYCGGYCALLHQTVWSYYRYTPQACYCSNTPISNSDYRTSQDGDGHCLNGQYNVDIALASTLYEFAGCYKSFKPVVPGTPSTSASNLEECLNTCGILGLTAAFLPSKGSCTCGVTTSGKTVCNGSSAYFYKKIIVG